MKKLNVFGGPHHGRVIEVDNAVAGAEVTFPRALPDGEHFAPGRTHPELFNDQGYRYVVTIARNSGDPYLAYQGPIKATARFTVPQRPKITLSLTEPEAQALKYFLYTHEKPTGKNALALNELYWRALHTLPLPLRTL